MLPRVCDQSRCWGLPIVKTSLPITSSAWASRKRPGPRPSVVIDADQRQVDAIGGNPHDPARLGRLTDELDLQIGRVAGQPPGPGRSPVKFGSTTWRLVTIRAEPCGSEDHAGADADARCRRAWRFDEHVGPHRPLDVRRKVFQGGRVGLEVAQFEGWLWPLRASAERRSSRQCRRRREDAQTRQPCPAAASAGSFPRRCAQDGGHESRQHAEQRDSRRATTRAAMARRLVRARTDNHSRPRSASKHRGFSAGANRGRGLQFLRANPHRRR